MEERAAGGDSPPAAQPDTRTRILLIAGELFRRRGYTGTSMRDISVQLGTTKAALYYHFPRKEDILEALVAPALAALDRVIERAEAGPGVVDPATLLADVVLATLEASSGLGPLDLPDVVEDQAEQLSVTSRMERIAALLAGDSPDPAVLLRAHAAIGAVRSGMAAAARNTDGAADPGQLRERLERDLRIVVGAAVAALG